MRTLTSGLTALACGVLVAVAAPTTLTSPATAAAATHTCDGQKATIVGTDGDDVLRGTGHRDVIDALAGNDTVKGLGGNDLICGGKGSDHLLGGAGADHLFGATDERFDFCDDACFELIGDTLEGGTGADVLDPGYDDGTGTGGDIRRTDVVGDGGWVGDVVSYAHSATGVHLDLRHRSATGEGHDTLVGTALAHDIGVQGSPHDDDVLGSNQADYVDAGAGDDQVESGAGADVITETAGSGDDTYLGGQGGDQVTPVDGHDTVRTATGDDHITVGASGPSDSVQADAGPGNDDLTVSEVDPADVFDGGADTDLLVLSVSASGPLTVRADQDQVLQGGAGPAVHNMETWNVTATGPVTFVGGDEPDAVTVHSPQLDADLGAGDDVLVDRADQATIQLGDGHDVLDAPPHAPLTADFGPGDDLLAGSDDGPPYADKSVDGGLGTDTFAADGFGYTCTSFEVGTCHGAFVPPQCDGKAATIVGTRHGFETLEGTEGPDVIVALGDVTDINGNGGDDTICGTSDSDLSGGAGDDTIIADGFDTVSGGAGNDDLQITRAATLDFSDAPGPLTIDIPAGTATGDGSDTFTIPSQRDTAKITGGPFDDHVTGGDEHDDIAPGPGNDTVTTAGGDDSVREVGTGTGDDVFDLGAGDDSATISDGSDTVDVGLGERDFVSAQSASRGPISVTGAETALLGRLKDGDSAAGGHAIWTVDGERTSLDLGAGRLTAGGRTAVIGPRTSVEVDKVGDTTVIGTPGADEVSLGSANAQATLNARLLGGKDNVAGGVFGGGRVDLGRGADALFGSYRHMTLSGGRGDDRLALNLGHSKGNTCTGFERGRCHP